jgi:hypothetical protein
VRSTKFFIYFIFLNILMVGDLGVLIECQVWHACCKSQAIGLGLESRVHEFLEVFFLG